MAKEQNNGGDTSTAEKSGINFAYTYALVKVTGLVSLQVPKYAVLDFELPYRFVPFFAFSSCSGLLRIATRKNVVLHDLHFPWSQMITDDSTGVYRTGNVSSSSTHTES